MTDHVMREDQSMPIMIHHDALEPNQASTNLTQSQKAVIDYIEDTFSRLLAEIQRRPHGHPEIVLRKITSLKAHEDIDSGTIVWDIQDREVRYGFPGKTKEEAWRFAAVGKILSEIHEAILSGVHFTTGEIFYREPDLFKKQETVDRYINDIAYTCGVTRADLSITASARGLVAGLDSSQPDAVELISNSNDGVAAARTQTVKWILVVEKEAVFRLLVEKHLTEFTGQKRGLLVTAKGYPDLVTRGFLRHLADDMWKIGRFQGIFGLFDGDPDGIAILKTYRFGSKTLAREHKVSVPEMRWVGVELGETFRNEPLREATKGLTVRDRSKAKTMLLKDAEEAETGVTFLDRTGRRALQHMLMLNRKMEIEALEELEGGAAQWVRDKLQQNTAPD